ncbi:hypothetical protein Tco_0237625 [Tanacetum coccineum]
MSSYLFTLVMEILTIIMKNKVEGDRASVSVLNEAIEEFGNVSRLGVKECKTLLDKVGNTISNWKNKCLLYAGRLQLVASVLESIHKDRSNGRANVAWKNICKPKMQDGLGIKDLGCRRESSESRAHVIPFETTHTPPHMGRVSHEQKL